MKLVKLRLKISTLQHVSSKENIFCILPADVCGLQPRKQNKIKGEIHVAKSQPKARAFAGLVSAKDGNMPCRLGNLRVFGSLWVMTYPRFRNSAKNLLVCSRFFGWTSIRICLAKGKSLCERRPLSSSPSFPANTSHSKQTNVRDEVGTFGTQRRQKPYVRKRSEHNNTCALRPKKLYMVTTNNRLTGRLDIHLQQFQGMARAYLQQLHYC